MSFARITSPRECMDSLARLQSADSLAAFNQELEATMTLDTYVDTLLSQAPYIAHMQAKELLTVLLPAAQQGLLLVTQQLQSCKSTDRTALLPRVSTAVTTLLQSLYNVVTALRIKGSDVPSPDQGGVGFEQAGLILQPKMAASGFIDVLTQAAAALASVSPAPSSTAQASSSPAAAGPIQKGLNWTTVNSLEYLSAAVLELWLRLSVAWPTEYVVDQELAAAAPAIAKLGLNLMYEKSNDSGRCNISGPKQQATEFVKVSSETVVSRIAEALAETLNRQIIDHSKARGVITLSQLTLLNIALTPKGADIRSLLLCTLAHSTAAAWRRTQGRFSIQQHHLAMNVDGSGSSKKGKLKVQQEMLQVLPYHEQLMQMLGIRNLLVQELHVANDAHDLPVVLFHALSGLECVRGSLGIKLSSSSSSSSSSTRSATASSAPTQSSSGSSSSSSAGCSSASAQSSSTTGQAGMVRVANNSCRVEITSLSVDACIPMELRVPFLHTALELLLLHPKFAASSICSQYTQLVAAFRLHIRNELDALAAILQDIVCLLIPTVSSNFSTKFDLAGEDTISLVGLSRWLIMKVGPQHMAAVFQQQPIGCCMLLEAAARTSSTSSNSAYVQLGLVRRILAMLKCQANEAQGIPNAEMQLPHLFSLLLTCCKVAQKAAALPCIMDVGELAIAIAASHGGVAANAAASGSRGTVRRALQGRAATGVRKQCSTITSIPIASDWALWLTVVARSIHAAALVLQQSDEEHQLTQTEHSQQQQEQSMHQEEQNVALLHRCVALIDWLNLQLSCNEAAQTLVGSKTALQQLQTQCQQLQHSLQEATQLAEQLQSASQYHNKANPALQTAEASSLVTTPQLAAAATSCVTTATAQVLSNTDGSELSASDSRTSSCAEVTQSSVVAMALQPSRPNIKLLDDALRQVAGQAQPNMAAVFAHLPFAYCCGNIACSDLGHGSELKLASQKASRCSGCRLVRFCSKECQSAAWPLHRPVCKALQAKAKRG